MHLMSISSDFLFTQLFKEWLSFTSDTEHWPGSQIHPILNWWFSVSEKIVRYFEPVIYPGAWTQLGCSNSCFIKRIKVKAKLLPSIVLWIILLPLIVWYYLCLLTSHYVLSLHFLSYACNYVQLLYMVSAVSAPVKRAGKVDQPTSKPTSSQSSVFVFKGAQAAPAANVQTTATARPAGMSAVCIDLLICAN